MVSFIMSTFLQLKGRYYDCRSITHITQFTGWRKWPLLAKKKRTIVSFSPFKVLQSSYDIYSPHPPPPIHPHLLLLCVIMTLFSLHLLTSAYIHCKRYKNHYKNAAGFLICKTIFSPMLTKIKEFKKYPFKESS